MRDDAIQSWLRKATNELGKEMEAHVRTWTWAHTSWNTKAAQEMLEDGIDVLVLTTYKGTPAARATAFNETLTTLPATVPITWAPEKWMVSGIHVPATFNVAVDWSGIYEESMAQERRAMQNAKPLPGSAGPGTTKPGTKPHDYGPVMGLGRDYEE